MELCPQLRRSLRGQVDEIERKIVPFGESMKDGRRKFIARKFRIENYDAFSGQSALPEHHRCRDTFASLKKTCRKLGVRFWDYLQDRVRGLGQLPGLADLIRQKAQETATNNAAAVPA